MIFDATSGPQLLRSGGSVFPAVSLKVQPFSNAPSPDSGPSFPVMSSPFPAQVSDSICLLCVTVAAEIGVCLEQRTVISRRI